MRTPTLDWYKAMSKLLMKTLKSHGVKESLVVYFCLCWSDHLSRSPISLQLGCWCTSWRGMSNTVFSIYVWAYDVKFYRNISGREVCRHMLDFLDCYMSLRQLHAKDVPRFTLKPNRLQLALSSGIIRSSISFEWVELGLIGLLFYALLEFRDDFFRIGKMTNT